MVEAVAVFDSPRVVVPPVRNWARRLGEEKASEFLLRRGTDRADGGCMMPPPAFRMSR